MKSVSLLLVLSCLHFIGNGQNYVQINDGGAEKGEWLHFVSIVDTNEVFILSDFYSKKDSNSVIFSRSFDTDDMDLKQKKQSVLFDKWAYPSALIKNKNGNFIVTGSTSDDFYNENSFLSEISSDGDLVWSAEYESDRKERVEDVVEVDDGYVMVGWKFTEFDETGHRYSNGYVRKLSSSGDSLWTVYFSDAGQHYGGGRVILADFNSVYFVYKKEGIQGDFVYLSKFDGHTGKIYWEKEIDKSDSGFGINDIIKLENNNLLIVGDLFDASCRPLILWEVDGDGNVVLKKDDYSKIKCWQGQGFCSTMDGGFVAVANASYPKLMKFDKAYNIEWIKTYEFDKGMSVSDVVQLDNGDFILIGNYGSKSEIDALGWLIRTNETGDLTSLKYTDDSKFVIEISPNPTHSIIDISVTNSDVNHLSIKLFDIRGKEILTSKFKEQINLSEIAPGVYYLHIFDENQLIRVEKVVKI